MYSDAISSVRHEPSHFWLFRLARGIRSSRTKSKSLKGPSLWEPDHLRYHFTIDIAHVLAKRTARKTFLVCTCYPIACVCKLRGREKERERDGSIQIIRQNTTIWCFCSALPHRGLMNCPLTSWDKLTSQGYGRHLPPFSRPRKFSLKAGIIPRNFPPWLWDGWRVKPQSGPVIVGDHP